MLIACFSCSSKKNILLLQDPISESYSSTYDLYKISIDDILKIEVLSDDPELPTSFSSQVFSNPNATKTSLLYNGYQVNSNGFIDFPVLGKLKVSGKTLEEARDYIYNEIVEKGILVSPSVDVKLLNYHFTILGEINSPGRYEFLENNLNIFEAIGYAKGFTIYGLRNNIKIIRDVNGDTKVHTLDLTNNNILNSENFQIISGDIIIVNQNTTRIKNAGIIGNSGVLISLLSFILSSIIVISN